MAVRIFSGKILPQISSLSRVCFFRTQWNRERSSERMLGGEDAFFRRKPVEMKRIAVGSGYRELLVGD
ncbi:hypothetical protein CDAR_376251 [Caerostris darwini]|uniref:Uncharacterized protein n=1 Tax=Caerostris darwini TaxID=1538125 RepID=A0AAV4QMT3_9ARAC|nr:hypothetical protein CDAR_376251 [Caerostris darwini]